MKLTQNNQVLLKQLTEAGFWGASDPGDPAKDKQALGVLLNRVDNRLKKNARFYVNSPCVGRLYYETRLIGAGAKHSLATGLTLAEAICNTALVLPSFLKEHPQYDASSRSN